jgi:glutathione synthase/RimK-type ligase-like ATP-grasp enzyme
VNSGEAHVQVELPKAIQRKLLCFMKRAGLQYGAIDLIETPGGDFVFLEVNPSGQWEWIVVLAGLPIPQAVADMLATA